MPNVEIKQAGTLLLLATVSLLTLVLFALLPIGVDWRMSYIPAWQELARPYHAGDFAGVPLLLLFLPHATLPAGLGAGVNLLLHIGVLLFVVRKLRGGWLALAFVLINPLFFDLMRTNNADWVPLLALLLPQEWGMVALVAKPQSIGGMALIWLKTSNARVRLLLPLALLLVLSFVLWGNWLPLMLERGAIVQDMGWNAAPFPLLVPAGLWLLWRAWQTDNALLAGLATPLLMPYIAFYSLVAWFTLLACRYPRVALLVYTGVWWYTVVELRRFG